MIDNNNGLGKCCEICGCATSIDDMEDKEKQIKETGEYFHPKCIEKIKNNKAPIMTGSGFYTYNGQKISDSEFRGFSGAEITVVYKDKIEKTNNLWHILTINESTFKFVKDKVNAILIWTWGLNENDIIEARKYIKKPFDREWHTKFCKKIINRNKKDLEKKYNLGGE